MKTNSKLRFSLSLLVLVGAHLAQAQARDIDPMQSSVTVRVFKSGVFSAFGHNHEIAAPVSGRINEEKKSVEISVQASELKVLDPDRPQKERMEVQETMLGPQVLDVQKFPTIQFRSRSVESGSWDKFTVRGDLTLHGQTRPVRVDVVRAEEGKYTATATLKQTDFGITPVAVAGGTVKVKDEVKLEFTIEESDRRAAVSSQ